MRILNHYRPEVVASKDETRYNLTHVHLNVARKRLESTDGHKLVCIPVEACDGDVDGLIPVEAFAAARKGLSKSADIIMDCSKKETVALVDGRTFPRVEATFPDVDAVMPKDCWAGRKVSFDVNYLLQLAKALGADEKGSVTGCTLVFTSSDPKDAIVVYPNRPDSDGAVAVLMPMRSRHLDAKAAPKHHSIAPSTPKVTPNVARDRSDEHKRPVRAEEKAQARAEKKLEKEREKGRKQLERERARLVRENAKLTERLQKRGMSVGGAQ